MISKEEMGAKIKKLRVEKGKSQEELGVALNRSHAAISDIERGKTDLTVRDLYEIARFFDVPVTEFLTMEERNDTVHGTFSHNRDSKDMTPDEKAIADRTADDIFRLVKAKLNQEENK